jgi:hypothetical protein
MCVEFESKDDLASMDDFERELRAAMRRQSAPAGLKRAVMARRQRERAEQRRRMVWFERLAASLVLAGVVSGAMMWRHAQEQRKGEEARQQVFTALRITNHALQEMKVQLEEHNRDAR